MKSRTLEDDLFGVANKLSSLGSRIDRATFEERRRAVVELVKEIQVLPQEISGKHTPVVTITYRFNVPSPRIASPEPAVVLDHTLMSSV